MAYLDLKTLTCPACGFSAEVSIVVGVGPHSMKGDTPYRRYRKAEPFAKGPDGTLLCPTDATELWRNTPGQRAEPSE